MQQKDKNKRGWDKSPNLSIIFELSSKTQWLSGLYYTDPISFYSPTQLCGGGTTKSNSNELPISVPLSLIPFYLFLSSVTVALMFVKLLYAERLLLLFLIWRQFLHCVFGTWTKDYDKNIFRELSSLTLVASLPFSRIT